MDVLQPTAQQTATTSGVQPLLSPAGDIVGKVVAGYQGWFGAGGDGSPLNSWQHGNLECWPEVTEYLNTYAGAVFNQAGVVQPAYSGNLGNGQPAKMFSSWSSQTVAKHFQWMQQYGVDCAALQRFGSYLTGGAKKDFFDQVVAKARNSAEVYGRKFYIMYDCTATTNCEDDWTNYMQTHTNSSAYARQNGKPVVCFWGVGKSDRGAIADWVTKINWFKAHGCYVIGGVLQGWRGGTDMSAYNACDMIMPWMVGRTTNFQTWYTDDLTYCNAHNLDYQADIYPGTAFYNTNGASSPKNQIPRLHGDFMWSQFAAAKNAGVQSVYISMFDELNEATQIMKTAESSATIPAGKYFLTLDADGVACSSDFYLRLTGDGSKMVKGLLPYVASHPTPHTVSGGVTFYESASYGGAASQVLPVGNYTMSQLAARGMPNEWASSVKVPAGRTLIMYADDNFAGTSWTVTADTPNLGTLSPTANDKVSSVKVQ